MFLEQQNENGNLPIILRPPKNLEETIKFLEENLCVSDIIKLCRLQSWALKGYWPLVFPGRGHAVPLFSEYTAGSKSGDHLRMLIKDNQDVSLPRKIIIEDNGRFLKAHLRESTLEPRGFSYTSGPSDYVVTRGPQQASSSLTVGPTNVNQAQDRSETTMSAQSDSEDEVFFAGSQFGDIPPNPQANDDTLPQHSSQSSGSQPHSSPSALNPSQTPSQAQSQTPSQSSPSVRSTFQSVLPENMDQGLDGLGKCKI